MANGREEAMITVVGQVKGGPRERSGPRATSPAIRRRRRGRFVSLAQIRVATEIESPGGESRLTIALDVNVDRQAGIRWVFRRRSEGGAAGVQPFSAAGKPGLTCVSKLEAFLIIC